MNPKAVGELSEGIVIGHLSKLGWVLLLPLGNNRRYDLVIDKGGEMVRAQVKTGRLRNGCVVFSTSSKNGFTGERRGYKGQADVFLVYCPDNDKVYMVPVGDVSENCGFLRVVQPRIKITAPIRWASSYELTLSPLDLDKAPPSNVESISVDAG